MQNQITSKVYSIVSCPGGYPFKKIHKNSPITVSNPGETEQKRRLYNEGFFSVN